MLDQGGINVILNQTEFINVDVLASDYEFSVLTQAAGDDWQFLDLLTEIWAQQWSIINKTNIECPWFFHFGTIDT